jgi:hypothetical protein
MIVVSSVIGVSLLWRFWQASNTRHDTPPSQIPSPRFMHNSIVNAYTFTEAGRRFR